MKVLILLSVAWSVWAAPQKPVILKVYPAEITLSGAGASQQLLVIASGGDGVDRDVTAEVQWKLSQTGVANVSPSARLEAAGDGKAVLTATLAGAKPATAPVQVSNAKAARAYTFTRDISAILVKRGCNSTACHGSVKGRGGLKFSANALYPKEDYDWIVKGGGYQVLTTEVKGERIPRIDLKNPEKSLLLTKPLMVTPHGGGKRLEPGSADLQVLTDWIHAGAPFGDDTGKAPKLVKLSLVPSMAILTMGSTHRLLVTGHFSDGHTEDFTHQVLYVPNDPDVVSVSAEGVITPKTRGETAILIRAAGQVASAGVGVIGDPVPNYPAVSKNNFIDQHIFDKLRRFQIVPSALSSDGEFLRRVCLDLTGTLPPSNRVKDFLASKDPAKREKVVDALIASPEFVDYWTWRFSDLFRVSIFTNGLSSKWAQGYWEWIRDNVERNRPYDEVARERLSAQGYSPATRHFLPYNVVGTPADTMAEEVRVFFGRRMDCAQCHNHPYENWSQDQFWGMAAFFGRMFKVGTILMDHPVNMDLSSKDVDGKIEVLHPRTKAQVQPALLDNSKFDLDPAGNPRKELAAWMTSHPYFAEAAVNRIWGLFFARGIVDPVDDFRSTNPPTHPELLAALAKDFQDHKFNLRHLMKTIVMSRTYQLAYEPNATNKHDVVNYSRSWARAIDAEVLLDAVVDVTGVPETFSTAVSDGGAVGQAPPGTRAVQLRDPDTFYSRFLELYGRANRGAVPERNARPNLGQALHVLAGSTYVERLGGPDSRLGRLLKAGATNAQIIEDFYLAAYSRVPTADETKAVEEILARRSDRESGLREFVWALISSREFAENH